MGTKEMTKMAIVEKYPQWINIRNIYWAFIVLSRLDCHTLECLWEGACLRKGQNLCLTCSCSLPQTRKNEVTILAMCLGAVDNATHSTVSQLLLKSVCKPRKQFFSPGVFEACIIYRVWPDLPTIWNHLTVQADRSSHILIQYRHHQMRTYPLCTQENSGQDSLVYLCPKPLLLHAQRDGDKRELCH